jgi:chorismate dehydratase
VTGSYKLGSVPYLNAEPLIWPLERKIIDHPHTITRAVPGELVGLLAGGQLDCALAPVAALLEKPSLVPVADVAIACRGPVASVLIFHDGPFPDLTRIWLDPASRTSNILVRILRSKASEKPCEYTMPGIDGNDPPPPVANLPQDVGRLVIGDPALSYASESSDRSGFSDLGALWKEMTNLPATFAQWIARDGDIARNMTGLVREARDWSMLHLHEIVEPLAERYDFKVSLVDRYLRQNITYMFGLREEAGLREYFRLARELGLA